MDAYKQECQEKIATIIIAHAKETLESLNIEEGKLPCEKNFDARKTLNNIIEDLQTIRDIPEVFSQNTELWPEISRLGTFGNYGLEKYRAPDGDGHNSSNFYNFNLKATYNHTKQVVDNLYLSIGKAVGRDPGDYVKKEIIPGIINDQAENIEKITDRIEFLNEILELSKTSYNLYRSIPTPKAVERHYKIAEECDLSVHWGDAYSRSNDKRNNTIEIYRAELGLRGIPNFATNLVTNAATTELRDAVMRALANTVIKDAISKCTDYYDYTQPSHYADGKAEMARMLIDVDKDLRNYHEPYLANTRAWKYIVEQPKDIASLKVLTYINNQDFKNRYYYSEKLEALPGYEKEFDEAVKDFANTPIVKQNWEQDTEVYGDTGRDENRIACEGAIYSARNLTRGGRVDENDIATMYKIMQAYTYPSNDFEVRGHQKEITPDFCKDAEEIIRQRGVELWRDMDDAELRNEYDVLVDSIEKWSDSEEVYDATYTITGDYISRNFVDDIPDYETFKESHDEIVLQYPECVAQDMLLAGFGENIKDHPVIKDITNFFEVFNDYAKHVQMESETVMFNRYGDLVTIATPIEECQKKASEYLRKCGYDMSAEITPGLLNDTFGWIGDDGKRHSVIENATKSLKYKLSLEPVTNRARGQSDPVYEKYKDARAEILSDLGCLAEVGKDGSLTIDDEKLAIKSPEIYAIDQGFEDYLLDYWYDTPDYDDLTFTKFIQDPDKYRYNPENDKDSQSHNEQNQVEEIDLNKNDPATDTQGDDFGMH